MRTAVVRSSAGGRKSSFEVITPTRVYSIIADNDAIRDQWTEHLQKVIQLFK